MHADIEGFLKCGTLGFPCFRGNRRSFLAKPQQSFYSLPGSLGNRAYFKTNLGYSRKSLQVVEKVEKEMHVKDNMPEYPAVSSYDSAMEALSSLITRRNRGDPSTTGGSHGKLERVSKYLKILGLEDKIKGLKIIHVAGTKGKGSTCAFCEAILRNCGFRTGLFTSPHLIDVRERFRLDGLDISEEKFLQYFWECWKPLKEKAGDGLTMPPLFQFLTVLAFKIFVCEKVDVAIIEVGLGGKLDSTNVIQEPIVCGIASLGMDHMETLGNTLAEIASHKAGIFKPQIPAFTVPQLSEAMEVLQQKANNLKAPLKVAAPLDLEKLEGVTLSLSGDHQLVNAGLAVSLSRCWLQRTGNWEKISPKRIEEDEIPDAFRRGLSMAYLPGRAQVVHDVVSNSHNSSDIMGCPCGELTFYLDGAHSPESMEACGQWFSATVKGNKSLPPRPLSSYQGVNGCIKHEEFGRNSNKVSKQILLFNCMEVRDPQVLLPRLISTCASSGTHFSRALFVPSMSTYNKVISGTSGIPSDAYRKDLTWQFRVQRLWEKIIHGKDAMPENIPKLEGTRTSLPPPDFLYGDYHCSSADKCVSCSAVMPSLPLTISWLRDCVKGNPSLKLEVLVTGSLHLVGDVLRLIRRR